MTLRDPKIVIIGAGPTGLGAAWRLTETGYQNWSLFDAAETPGGLASSIVDENGFTWDLGGHVLFSHYEYFDTLMDVLLGTNWVEHIRESWVWMRGRFIPYPLQNNIWRLPSEEFHTCLDSLISVRTSNGVRTSPKNFYEWIVQNFGEGLAQTFMLPYNRKVWAYDPQELGISWMGERVATVDVARIIENLVLQRDDCGWGPNARFRFPLRGGSGAIWKSLVQKLPSIKLNLKRHVVRIHSDERRIVFEDGDEAAYDYLISSMPLDVLLGAIVDRGDLSIESQNFKHSSSHIVGIGFEGSVPEKLATKCWMYFPEPTSPFYRVTVFSNYSPYNVPRPGNYWSLLCEVSESPVKPVNQKTVVESVVKGLRNVGLIDSNSMIVSRWHRRLEYGYPTPFVGRDDLLARIDPALRKIGIWSRGRFGGWKYEVSNQDHSLMQGVEAVDYLLFADQEVTYLKPQVVNLGKVAGQRLVIR